MNTREKISRVWEEILLINLAEENSDSAHAQHNAQDIAFVISQLIEPTISIIVSCATLYVFRKDRKNKETSEEKNIEKKKNEIKEIFDNYNINIENMDDVISEILTKIKD